MNKCNPDFPFGAFCGSCDKCIEKAFDVVVSLEKIPLESMDLLDLDNLRLSLDILLQHFSRKGYLSELSNRRPK